MIASAESARQSGRRWLRAAAALVAVAVIWLIALPWLAEQEPIRQHVDSLHAADINASAMFYSELECGYMLRHRANPACRMLLLLVLVLVLVLEFLGIRFCGLGVGSLVPKAIEYEKLGLPLYTSSNSDGLFSC